MRNGPESNDRCPGANRHLEDGLCLDLIAGLLDKEQKQTVLAHLERCPECEAMVRDLYGDYFRAESHLAGLSAEPGLSPERSAGAPTDRTRMQVSGTRFAQRWRYPVLVGAAALAAVCLLVLWPTDPDQISPRSDLEMIRTSLGERSTHGLVFPGTDLTPPHREANHREGLVDEDVELIEALNSLEVRRRQDGISADETYWLTAGHIARGQLSRARSLLPSRNSSEAAKARWIAMAAQIAYRESDLTEARDLLLRVLRQEAGDPVHAFNLGLVLCELEDADSARVHLYTAAEAAGGTLLGTRARALLDSLGSEER